MKLLIILMLVAVAAAGTVPEVQIKSIVLPEPAIRKYETPYVPRPEPISFGMIMVPQDVLDAVAAEERMKAEMPVDVENFNSIDNIEVEPAKVADVPVYETISAGELETIRVAMPEVNEDLNAVESVMVVDAPIEPVQMNEEAIKIINAAPLPSIRAQYPPFLYLDPYWR